MARLTRWISSTNEHVALLQRGEDGGHVALALECRPGDRADPDAELLAHDLRQRRLAEARRPDEQHVVERLAACRRRIQGDPELLLDPLLADEVVEAARPQAALDLVVLRAQSGCQELGHAAAAVVRRARRMRSSAGRSGSTSASACSASTIE